MLKMNSARFGIDVTRMLREKSLTIKEVSEQLETRAHFVEMAANGMIRDLYTYLALCELMNKPPDTYVIKPQKQDRS